MPNSLRVIKQLEIIDGELKCKTPTKRSYQKAHYKQGDLDGACGAYSLAMVLNILGVFESDELYSNTEFDKRTAEWKLISAINAEKGLFRDGMDSEKIVSIVNEKFHKYVTAESFSSDIEERITQSLEDDNPVILRIKGPVNLDHWVVCVGYAFDKKDKITSFLILDPGSDSPKSSLWNGWINLKQTFKKKYKYESDWTNNQYVGFKEIVIIKRRIQRQRQKQHE